EASHSRASTPASSSPKLAADAPPSVPPPPAPSPAPPPDRRACSRCNQLLKDSPPDFPAGRFLPQGDSPRFPGSFQAILAFGTFRLPPPGLAAVRFAGRF